MLLAELSSKQIGDWLAYGMLEQVGHPVPPDPEAQAKARAKTQRAKVEGGLRALKEKQQRQ